MILKAI